VSAAPGPPAARAVTALLVLTAVGTAAFWIGFFAAGDALHSADTDVYLAFETAFPAADAWMASAALAAAIGLARRRAWAIPAGIAAGSALVFLGLMDVLYDLEHALYARPSGAMAVETAINVFCLVVGPFLMAYFWRHRDHLDGVARP
jgi:hypothetical protein